MTTIETAEQIGRNRMVSAAAVLEGRAQLDGYPFHYLAVTSDSVSWTLHAVEHLRQHGWELINVAPFTTMNTPHAFLRRVPPVDGATGRAAGL